MTKYQTKYKQTEIGEIPEDWEVNTISNFTVEIIDGDRGLNYPKQDEFFPDGYCLFLSTKNVPSDKFDFTERFFVTEEKDKLLRKGKLQRDDMVLTTRGTVGNIALFDKKVTYDNIRINSGMVILRNKGKDFNLEFLYQLLKSGVLRRQYISFSSGSAQPQLPIKDLKDILLVKPPLEEQEKIADILSSLDYKIDLNKKMNKTLEEIGKALFKRWFVDFEFPNEDGKPYRSSGGEMTDSELGEIPKNWRVGKLSDFGRVVCGKTPPKSDPDYFGGETPFIKIPDMHNKTFIVKTEDMLSEKGKNFQQNKTLPKFSLCVSCIATVGLISITSQESQTNQQINSIVPSDLKFLPYLYFQLKSMMRLLVNYASGGSTTPNLNSGDFAELSVIFPENKVLSSFFSIIWSLFEQILNNDLGSMNLKQTRGSLLPRLMCGRLRVKL